MSTKYDKSAFQGAWIDKYYFQKYLGGGSYADVWLADECGLNREFIRPVAVKVFVSDFADRQEFQAISDAFRNDLGHLAGLAPDNPIVQYYNYSAMFEIAIGQSGVFETVNTKPAGGAPTPTVFTAFLIVMEYADGGPLGPAYRDALILGDKPEYFDNFIDVCTGLRAAHSNQIIHRDIKPNNLLWFKKDIVAGKPDRVKIADFGIAKNSRDLQPGKLELIGTLPYMSPESFEPGAHDTPARDIYALGCTFYELLTGEPAFSLPRDFKPASKKEEIEAYRAVHERAKRPDAFVKAPSIASVELSSVIKKMMHVNPTRRPSIDEVVAALQEAKMHNTLPTPPFYPAPIPAEPVFRSTHNINPNFRQKILKEDLFFLFISMPIRTEYRYGLLFGTLAPFFGNTYSIWELYGKYDFAIRVWSNKETVAEFARNIVRSILDNDRGSLRAMACAEVHYSDALKDSRPRAWPLAETLIRLNEAQHEDGDSEAKRWLTREKVYVRPIRRSIAGSRVPCLCLISQPNTIANDDRRERFDRLKRTIVKELAGTGAQNVAFYRKAWAGFDDDEIENENSDYVVSYIAASFDRVIRIPTIILDKPPQQQMRVQTLLGTKRYFVESDAVRNR